MSARENSIPSIPVPAALSSQVAFQARDFRAALALARRAIALNPGFWFGYQMQAQAEAQLSSTDAAMQSVLRAMELSDATASRSRCMATCSAGAVTPPRRVR